MCKYVIGFVLCLGLVGCYMPEDSVLCIENRSSYTIIYSNMQIFDACSIDQGQSECLCGGQTDVRIRIDRKTGIGTLTTYYFLDDQHGSPTLKTELKIYKYFPFGPLFYRRDCYKLIITDKDAVYNDKKLTPLKKQHSIDE